MKQTITTSTRLILGLIFVVFGLNGFLNFLPMPAPSPEGGQFLGALAVTGYFFPVLKFTEILAGALLLANIFTPLALILLSPIIVQIFLYHAILDPAGLLLPIIIVILQSYLGYTYFAYFKPLFSKNI